MSVYTRVERNELEVFLRLYQQGDLVDFQGINDGIENTNYFVTTTKGKFVLTLFEVLTAAELPYFLNLMAFFAEHDIPSAHPIADKDQSYSRILAGKPTALVQRLNGSSIKHPNETHCQAVGTVLGQMHKIGQTFHEHRDNNRGPHWWNEMQHKLASRLDPADKQLLDDEMRFQVRYRDIELPRGVIHADLFHDNVLFVDDTLSGIIDFYYACDDVLLYDVAVAVNDWCSLEDGSLNEQLVGSFISAYQQQRPVTDIELEVWPVLLRAAALRFWLSRLHDLHFPRGGEITHTKDPEVFKRILCQRIEHQNSLQI